MNGGRYGGRSPPRPHLFGGLNFPVVSEEGNTSILRSNADQEQEEKPMRLKHKVRINIADKSGNKQEVLQSEHRSILIPISVQAHHSFVDGIHIGQFVDALQKFFDEY